MQEKQQWSSPVGFVLAAVGSAVGLGNIWRFPYVVYSSGGGAFFVPYFCAIFTAGIPLVILEYALGHSYGKPLPQIMGSLHKRAQWLGWWPAIASGFILCYYSMILGWAVNYLVLSLGNGWGQDTNRFFHEDFVQLSSSPTNLGHMVWYVLAGILLLWMLNFFICAKNIRKGLEKLNRVLLPLLLLIILVIVIKSLTMPGAIDGLNALFTPDFSRLGDPNIWISAYGQVFFSLSLASGIMVAFASYLPKKSDINNNAFMTAFANCGFELLCAIGVFAILGVMMQLEGKPIEALAQSGTGLAFLVFPRFFSETGLPVLGFLFFLCLLFAGLTSSVSMIESLSAPITQKFGLSRRRTAGIICGVGAAVSTIYATQAGLYILEIVDTFLSNYSIVTIGLIEALIGGWVIRAKFMREYVNEISYFKIGHWWDICIRYITPLVLTVTLVQSLAAEIRLPFGGYSRLDTLVYGWGTLGLIVVLAIILGKKKEVLAK